MTPELYDPTVPPKRVLVTGCAGSGRSSLVNGLASRDVPVIRDPSVRVIRLEERTGGTGLPWQDEARYVQLCQKMAIADWEAARSGLTLFDRGLFDVALHLERLGHCDAARDFLTRFPFDTDVYVTAPWQALFEADAARRESFAQAQEAFAAVEAGLARLGYKAVPVPQVPLAERVDWLAARLGPL